MDQSPSHSPSLSITLLAQLPGLTLPMLDLASAHLSTFKVRLHSLRQVEVFKAATFDLFVDEG